MTTTAIDLSKDYTETEWKVLLDALDEQIENCRKAGDLKQWDKIGALFVKCYDIYYAKFKEATHGQLGKTYGL